MPTHDRTAVPASYRLKRIAAMRPDAWNAPYLDGIAAAPVYLFPDREAFDSDAWNYLAEAMQAEPVHLPHDAVLFEVGGGSDGVTVVYAVQIGDGAVVSLFLCEPGGHWRQGLVTAFLEPGMATGEIPNGNESVPVVEDMLHGLCGQVYRALTILDHVAADVRLEAVPSTRRPKLARSGVSGWASTGTHAPPRWHIRRGHWRHLADRSVFVRACEVGDKSRGGVVKDYVMEERP
jgi:hypothetical protein